MSITEKERKSADYHAGPGESFPVNDDGGHFAAAWHLAETGHGSDPHAILAHLRSFAEEHNLTHLIPKTEAKKATGGDLRELYDHAFNHAMDNYDRAELVRYAGAKGHQQYLPNEAHPLLHETNTPHNHDGITNDSNGMHEHVVTKAFNTGEIVKSWFNETGDVAHYEGWLSTPHFDREKDITEPTAFINPMDDYFRRRAPVSLIHDGESLPIGHLQKAAVLVDGKVVKSQVHPTDPGEFEHLPITGSGVWVLGAINEEPGISAIRKGNVGGQSFIATAKAESLPGGRYRYVDFDPWVESTIAPYPINPKAIIATIKAYGLKESDTTNMALQDILDAAQAEIDAKKAQEVKEQAVVGVTKAELGATLVEFKDLMFGEIKAQFEAQVEEIRKAVPARGQGTGRQGTVITEDQKRDNDPLAYLLEVTKASKGDDENISEADKVLMGALTHEWLTQGLPALNGNDDEE